MATITRVLGEALVSGVASSAFTTVADRVCMVHLYCTNPTVNPPQPTVAVSGGITPTVIQWNQYDTGGGRAAQGAFWFKATGTSHTITVTAGDAGDTNWFCEIDQGSADIDNVAPIVQSAKALGFSQTPTVAQASAITSPNVTWACAATNSPTVGRDFTAGSGDLTLLAEVGTDAVNQGVTAYHVTASPSQTQQLGTSIASNFPWGIVGVELNVNASGVKIRRRREDS